MQPELSRQQSARRPVGATVVCLLPACMGQTNAATVAQAEFLQSMMQIDSS